MSFFTHVIKVILGLRSPLLSSTIKEKREAKERTNQYLTMRTKLDKVENIDFPCEKGFYGESSQRKSRTGNFLKKKQIDQSI